MAARILSQRCLRNFVQITRQQIRHSSKTTLEQTDQSARLLAAVHRQGSRATESGRMLTSHKVEVNGAQLHYEQVGTGKNVLMLLPGALGSSRSDFEPQLNDINKDMFTLVAWDPRGYGKSIPPARDWPAHFFERDAEDAAKLMQALGARQYSLLGWSDGGITAMIVAARYPNLVRKLVVWGANSYVTKEEIEMYNSLKDIDQWSERMKKRMIEMYGEEYFREQWGMWIDAITRYYTERGGDICQDELDKIECPTLIVHGDKDSMVPGFHPEHLHKHIKNSRLYRMPEGKHNLHLKYHAQFNSTVENFLLETD